MASTNKTTNYDLSQFLGTDKPAWLGDYNSDMNKIDTGIHAAQTTATAANGKADSANSEIGNLTGLDTDTKTDLVSAVNEVNTKAGTAQNTANTALTQSTNNTNSINVLDNYLNLNNFTSPTITFTNFSQSSSATNYLQCASNNTGSLGKIYGQIRGISTANTFDLTFPTPLRPNSAITINGIVTMYYFDSNDTTWTPLPKSIEIGTDGVARIRELDTVSGRQYRIFIHAAVIFAKSFSDTIIPD